MAVRAWRVWAVSTVLAGGLVALAQAPKTEIGGRVTPAITQEHYHPETAPPRVLPQQVRESNHSKTAPTAVKPAGNVIGLQTTDTPTVDLDTPSGVISPLWKARSALAIAEMHFDACDLTDAREWYQEVITLAPRSEYAATAKSRLEQMQVRPAAGETREPPLASVGGVTPAFPIR